MSATRSQSKEAWPKPNTDTKCTTRNRCYNKKIREQSIWESAKQMAGTASKRLGGEPFGSDKNNADYIMAVASGHQPANPIRT